MFNILINLAYCQIFWTTECVWRVCLHSLAPLHNSLFSSKAWSQKSNHWLSIFKMWSKRKDSWRGVCWFPQWRAGQPEHKVLCSSYSWVISMLWTVTDFSMIVVNIFTLMENTLVGIQTNWNSKYYILVWLWNIVLKLFLNMEITNLGISKLCVCVCTRACTCAMCMCPDTGDLESCLLFP